MNKWVYFVLGLISGGFLVFVFLFVLGLFIQFSDNNKYTYFEQPGEIVNSDAFKVIQTLEDNSALVEAKEPGEYDDFFGPTFLLINDDGKYYYDEEIVKVPKERKVRQVGRYRYRTQSGEDKTVSIIKIVYN